MKKVVIGSLVAFSLVFGLSSKPALAYTPISTHTRGHYPYQYYPQVFYLQDLAKLYNLCWVNDQATIKKISAEVEQYNLQYYGRSFRWGTTVLAPNSSQVFAILNRHLQRENLWGQCNVNQRGSHHHRIHRYGSW